MASPPAGSDLTIKQLLDACSWKLKHSAPTKGVEYGLSCSDGLQAKSECAELLQATRTISAHIIALQNSFLPINGLPIEILSYIFARVQDKTEHGMNILPPWPSAAIHDMWFQSLTQVCHHWRTTALSVPSLWRNIFETRGDSRRIQWFLKQSHPHPVRVIYFTDGTASATDLKSVASLLSRNVHRLELLSIAAGDDICRSEFKDLFSISFPALRTLAIDFTFVDELPLAVTQIRAPELRRLSLSSATLDSIPRTSVEHLTHLHLFRVLNRGPALEELLSLLQHTSSLISLGLNGACPSAVGVDPESIAFQALPVVALPHLERLHLAAMRYDDDALVLLYKLELPISSIVIWDNDRRISRVRSQNRAISSPPILSRIRFLLVTDDSTYRTQLQGFRLYTGSTTMAWLVDYMSTVAVLSFAKGISAFGFYPERISGDYAASSNAKELHFEIVISHLCDHLQFLDIKIQDSENPRFPCLTDLFLWWDRGKSVVEAADIHEYAHDESVEMNELKQRLIQTGKAARTKSDGNTYNVHLREFTGEFNWKWMKEQAKDLTFT